MVWSASQAWQLSPLGKTDYPSSIAEGYAREALRIK